MTLMNVKREKTRGTGSISWRLRDPNGDSISVFDEFCRDISNEAYATRARYAIVVSRLIDYFYEISILGAGAVTRSAVNKSIDLYLQLLTHGDAISLGRTSRDGSAVYESGDEELEQRLREVARRLQIRPLRPGSWSNTLPALNRFLRVCTLLESEAREIALLKGGLDHALVDASAVDYAPLLEAVNGCVRLTSAEVKHIKNTSMLGGVIRFRGEKLRRPRGLSSRGKGKLQGTQVLDFPMQFFPALLNAATFWRDRALWSLLAADGIRRSEALNLEWHHIDFERETVYVLDPKLTRYGRDLSENERIQRFKGRVVSWTYLRLPYRTWFFELLQEYRRREYVLPSDGNDFVFQYIIAPYRGRPLREAADSTLNDAFTSAVLRAKVPGPPMSPDYIWTCHSLRHAYGMYMLNDFEVPGQVMPGLTEAEVQLLMGHVDINATKKYARRREDRLREKLVMNERKIFPLADSISSLPPAIANRIAMDIEHSGGTSN
jgi:integrase